MINLKSKTSTFPRNAIWPPSGWQKREKGGRIIYICLLFWQYGKNPWRNKDLKGIYYARTWVPMLVPWSTKGSQYECQILSCIQSHFSTSLGYIHFTFNWRAPNTKFTHRNELMKSQVGFCTEIRKFLINTI